MKNIIYLFTVIAFASFTSNVYSQVTQAQALAAQTAAADAADAFNAEKETAESTAYNASFYKDLMENEYGIAEAADPRNNTHYAAGLAKKITGLQNDIDGTNKYNAGNTKVGGNAGADALKLAGDGEYALGNYDDSKALHDTAKEVYQAAELDMSDANGFYISAFQNFYDAMVLFIQAYTDV